MTYYPEFFPLIASHSASLNDTFLHEAIVDKNTLGEEANIFTLWRTHVRYRHFPRGDVISVMKGGGIGLQ